MRFDELRALLVELGRDPLSVTTLLHDDPETIGRAPADHWVIWHRSGRYDVGAEERGRFVVSASFDSEEAACDYLAGVFRRDAQPAAPLTEAEQARGDAVTAQANAELDRLLREQE